MKIIHYLHNNTLLWSVLHCHSTMIWMSHYLLLVTTQRTSIHRLQVDSPHKGLVSTSCRWIPTQRANIHRFLVDTPHKGPVMQKAFPCYDTIIHVCYHVSLQHPLPRGRSPPTPTPPLPQWATRRTRNPPLQKTPSTSSTSSSSSSFLPRLVQ